MTLRVLAAGAALSLLAGPAWADCMAEIEALDESIVAAETGAAADDGALPATQHQEEVLSGEDAPMKKAPMETGAGSATGSADVEAASPHQREALRELDDDTRTQASTLTDEARALADAGDEAGCLAKVGEAKALLGAQ